MAIIHTVFVRTNGKDPNKYPLIQEFDRITGKPSHYKNVASGFRMAGKVKSFVKEHQLTSYSYGLDYNGYGYSTHVHRYLMRPKDAKKLLELLSVPPKKKTKTDPKAAWCRRLAKLTGIQLAQAEHIADVVLEAKMRRIQDLEQRQYQQRYSSKREKLINKIWRENPLRRIKNTEHAYSVLQAFVRHNSSDYEEQLQEAKELAQEGRLEWNEVKNYARNHTFYYDDVNSYFFDKSEDDEED